MSKVTAFLLVFVTGMLLTGCNGAPLKADQDVEKTTDAINNGSAEKTITPEPLVISQVSIVTKTYTSQDYAVSFEYPENWTVGEDPIQLRTFPPQSLLSHYFTLTRPIDSPYSRGAKTLEELLAKKDLPKADFTIDEQDVYAGNTTGELKFYFSHQGKLYTLTSYETWYKMPEVKAIIASLKLN